MSAIIETRSLVVEYEPGVRALDDVSVAVGPDEFVSIIGPSGAGKSTLLRVMNRLICPISGEIILRGQNVTHASGRQLRSVRRRVGMVFQQFNLVPQLTVLENVLVGWIGDAPPLAQIPTLWRQFPTTAKAQAMAYLEQVHIVDRANARAGELSGGQQQRVAIARVLMQNPKVILADEPIASLDPGSAEIVMNTLRSITSDHGVPVVVNLHQVDIARKYATRLIGLRQGRIEFDESPSCIPDTCLDALYANERSTTIEAKPIGYSTHLTQGALA